MLSRRSLLGTMAAVGSALGSAVRGAHAAQGGAAASEAALKGKLYYRKDARYEAFRQAAVWNARKPNRHPEAIVMAESQDDVIAAVKLAKARGWQVGTRSGGHSWVAPHLRDNAVLINISRMKELSVDAQARTAVVSPGWQGQAFNKILREQHGLMFPTGHCYGIGLGGFVLAGGHGWNSRVWGPGCANLVALDLINADGELVHASETENSEYLWAARGGGAGFPGVAVRFHLKLYPRPPVMMYSDYAFPLESADDVLNWFGDWLHTIPKNMEASLDGLYKDGKPILRVAGRVLADSQEEAHAALDLLKSNPAMGKAFDAKVRVPASWPGDSESPATLSPTGARYVTDGAWSDASTKDIVTRIRPFFDEFPTKESWYLWMVWGETQKLPDMAYSIQGHSYLSPNGVWYDPADDDKVARWAQRTIDAVRDISNGGQMNDDNMAVNRLPYLSPAAEKRLAAFQAKVDPRKRFAGFLRS